MPTIRDVAKLANVSVATVSRVLNGSPRVSKKSVDAVNKEREELGFYLNANARALVQRDSHTIGVVVSEVSDPYFGAAVRACDDAIHKMGYNLLVGQGYHNAEREIHAIDDLISYQCRGLVVHALAVDDATLINYLETVPYMVLMNRVVRGYEERCLILNNYHGQCLAVQELIDKGHRKIAFVNSGHRILDADERFRGYVDTLKKAGIKYIPRLITSAEPSLEGGSQAALDLMNRLTPGEDFTAVACYSDVMAAGFMATLHAHGYKIPDDVSITGFDNLYLSTCLIPPLTTVNNPVKEISEEAILRSIDLYEGRPITVREDYTVELIKRDSVRQL